MVCMVYGRYDMLEFKLLIGVLFAELHDNEKDIEIQPGF